MPDTIYTLEQDRLIWNESSTLTFQEIGKKIGRSRHQVRGRLLQLNQEFDKWLIKIHDEAGQQKLTRELSDNSEVITCIDRDVKTVDELLEACQVDLKVWRVKNAVLNKWGGFARTRSYKAGPGDFRRQLTKVPLWQVKVWLERIDAVTQNNAILRDDLITDLQKHSPKYNPIKRNPATADDRMMMELSIPDHHFGKLCWGDETGMGERGNYDLKIAEEMYMTAVRDLLQKTRHFNLERILVPIGNDMMHVDGKENETANGTIQDTDGRWQKAFRVTKRCLVNMLDLCREIAPTHAIVIPGNHDTERMFYLGDVIASHFRLDSEVTVDNAPTSAKFIEYGKTLLGFTHGDTISEGELPMIMAATARDAFARTTHWEWHLGHRHTRKHSMYAPKSFKPSQQVAVSNGVHIRVLPALCPPDAWHAKHGYLFGPRASESYLWQFNEGYAGQLIHNPKLG